MSAIPNVTLFLVVSGEPNVIRALDAAGRPLTVAVAGTPEIARRLVELLNAYERVGWWVACGACGFQTQEQLVYGVRPLHCPACKAVGSLAVKEMQP